MATTTEREGRISALKEAVLESPLVYSLWQRPWVRAKLEPLLAHNDLAAVDRVLDIGCGPGTNAAWFEGCEYLGIDVNPLYVERAQRAGRGEFVAADARDLGFLEGRWFDFVLLNSFLHHVDDADAADILRQVAGLLSPGGSLHVLDLVLPEERCLARFLAGQDRGRHARPLPAWRELFAPCFDTVELEPFSLRLAGLTLWNMVYFKGRARP